MLNFSSHPRLFLLTAASLFLMLGIARGAVSSTSGQPFTYQDAHGKAQSASVITKYYPKKIEHPFASVDHRLDPKMMRAATLAQERAHAHSREQCWHYVKEALVASGVINSYPKSVYAKQAGDELVSSYGFKKLSIRDPYAAPVGAVLVYAPGRNGAGHVELRTKSGFASDFNSKSACPRKMIAAYAKLSS